MFRPRGSFGESSSRLHPELLSRGHSSPSASARKVLPTLAAQLDLPLPEAQPGPPTCRPRSSPDPPGPSTGFTGFAGGTRRGQRALGPHRGAAAAVRRTARPALSAGSGPGSRLSAELSAGSRWRAAGFALVRGGTVPAGAARCLPGVGRPHARSAHRADPEQRPLRAGRGRAGQEPGLARVGQDAPETGPGLGAGTRRAALDGGDLCAKFAAGHELQGGRLAVRGSHAGAAAGSWR